MSEVLSYSNPVARKTHKCEYCWGDINPGERYFRGNFVYDGHVYTWKNHLRCGDFMDDQFFSDPWNRSEGANEDHFCECLIAWREKHNLPKDLSTEETLEHWDQHRNKEAV